MRKYEKKNKRLCIIRKTLPTLTKIRKKKSENYINIADR